MAGMDDTGLEDAAIMLMSLGEEQAAEVFKHLAPKEVQRLGETIARLKTVPRNRFEDVVERFAKLSKTEHMLVPDSDQYVRDVLHKALGEEKAELLLDRILQGSDVSGIESLKWMEPNAVAELLRNEHPQIVATILVYLEFEQASSVLKLLPERQRNEILIRVATLDGVQPTALKDLNDVLGRLLSGGERARKSTLGGVKATAEILNVMGGSMEIGVLDYIRETDPDLARRSPTTCSPSTIWPRSTTAASRFCSRKCSRSLWWSRSRARHPNCGRRSSATCPRVRQRPCARTWRRAARYDFPRSRPSRRT